MKKLLFSERIAPVLCNMVTFIAVFVLIPAFAGGVPDFIWVSARVIAAVRIAVWFAGKYPSIKGIEVFLWSVVQDVMAYIFRWQLAGMLGVSTSSALWEFEYIGQVYAWITILAVIQPVAIAIKRKISDK